MMDPEAYEAWVEASRPARSDEGSQDDASSSGSEESDGGARGIARQAGARWPGTAGCVVNTMNTA